MYPVMRGYCVIQFLWDSSPWCFICSSRIHMGDDMSKILNYFDIWLVTCRRFWIFSTYGWWRVEDFRNFRHMAGVLFPQPLTLRRSGGSFWWVRRLVSLSTNRGIFRVFFLKICARNNAVKKKNGFTGFSCDFVSIYEYSLWRWGGLCDMFMCAGDQPLVYSIQ